MSLLTWKFAPAQGYENSIATAFINGTHIGHINVGVEANDYFATLKSEEDANDLGGEAGADTIERAMEQLEHRIATGEWPDDYMSGV